MRVSEASIWKEISTHLHSGIYGGIHVHDNTGSQSIATGATYTKVTAFDDADYHSQVEVDTANSKLIINIPGVYHCTGTFSFSSGTANVEWFGSIFLDGVEQENMHWTRKVSAANDVGSAALTGFFAVDSCPCDLDFRVRHDNGGSVNFLLSYGDFNARIIGTRNFDNQD
jgi:hypothetical protein